LGIAADLDDLVQETFVRAYRGLDRLLDAARFGAYVYSIARNLCADWLRARRPEVVSLERVDLEPGDPRTTTGALRDAERQEERLVALRAAVGHLPEALREAVLLFYFEQRSYADMADLLGVTEAAINQRLTRARQRLREHLVVAHGGDA
jgi:RNA polymerase sigma-70 factor (ECF subfamily)